MTRLAAPLALVASLASCGARNDLPGSKTFGDEVDPGGPDGDGDRGPLAAGTVFFATAQTFEGASAIAAMQDAGGAGFATYAGPGDLFHACVHTFDRNGRLLFSDDDARVMRLDVDTGRLDEAPFPGSLGTAYDIAVDTEGRLFIADAEGNRIIRYDRFQDGDGFAFGETGSGFRQLLAPRGVAVRADGAIFIADTGNSRVVRIDDLVGNGWREWTVPSEAGDAAPYDVAFDGAGRLYVTDFQNHSLWRIDDIDGSGATRLTVAEHQFSHVAVRGDGRIFLSAFNGPNAIFSIADMAGSDPQTFTGPEGQRLVNPCGVALR